MAATIALAISLSGCGGGSAGSNSNSSHAHHASTPQQTPSPTTASGFDGAELPGAPTAPTFTLTNIATGRRASLSAYRGHVVVLTFLYSTCGAPCILIAQQVRGALDELEERRLPRPVTLIVSADPQTDTPTPVKGFLAQVSLAGRADYLTGPLAALRRIWHAYEVRPASAGRAAFEEYASVVLIDAAGRERVLYQSEQLTPESLSHDIAKLEGRRSGAPTNG